jgi:serine/threonine-protein kinase
MAICPECLVSYGDEVQSCPDHGCELVPDDLFLPEEAPLRAGTMVGEYRIEKKLGAGTFGEVYAGEQPLIGKRVAVKVLNRRFASDPVMISRFVAEARAVNKIRQRNIIDIFSFGVLPELERHYFVMELLEGETLGALMDEMRRVPVAVAIPIVRGIADALDAAHKAGITHRDLKPDNVFVVTERDGSYFPKLLDFGIAKLLGDDVAHKTGSGMVLGTPRYMSPEQARGKPADHRADIYALGVMIHEMLTGVAPFVGESSVDLLLKHAVDPPPSMSSVCPDIPRALDVPVLAMLEKRPADRPQSAGEAVAALVACAQRLGLDRLDPASSRPARAQGGDPAAVVRTDDAVWSDPTLADRPRSDREAAPTRRDRPASAATTGRRPAPLAAAEPRTPRPRAEATSTLQSEKGASERTGDATEATSTLETASAINRHSRRWKLGGGAAAAVAVGLSIFALGRSREPARANVATAPDAGDPARPVAPTVPAVTTVSVAPSEAEPTVRPSVAAADVIELRLVTRPADAEVWLGDQKLGSAAGPVLVARGTDRVDLRLRKAGFRDEPLTLTPDRNQTLEATLAPLAPIGGRPAATAKPAASAHKMDRILGDRD